MLINPRHSPDGILTWNTPWLAGAFFFSLFIKSFAAVFILCCLWDMILGDTASQLVTGSGLISTVLSSLHVPVHECVPGTEISPYGTSQTVHRAASAWGSPSLNHAVARSCSTRLVFIWWRHFQWPSGAFIGVFWTELLQSWVFAFSSNAVF